MSHANLPSELATGVADFDNLHIDILEAMSAMTVLPDQHLDQAYDHFVTKVESAFSTEEKWMDEIDYPALQNHREQHARVLGALHKIYPKVMEGDIALTRDVIERLLPQWFMFHMATDDMVLAVALQTTDDIDMSTPA